MIRFYTKNCICCGERASVWIGHVHRNGEKVLAGFCRTHGATYTTDPVPGRKPRPNCVGCYGPWQEQDWIRLPPR